MANLPRAEVHRFGVAATAYEGLHEIFKGQMEGPGRRPPCPRGSAEGDISTTTKVFAPCWSSKPSQQPAPFRENPADLGLFLIPEPEAKLCCW